MTTAFTHLRVHSEYSLIDGTLRIKPLVKMAKAQGFDSLALTDVNNIFALIKFYKAAVAEGIKPILGAEVFVKDGRNRNKLVLLCQNLQGYTHLCELISEGYLHGQHDHQVSIDIAAFKKRTKGLIALSAGIEGLIGAQLLKQQDSNAEKTLHRYKQLFNDQFYIEINRLGKPAENSYIPKALALAEKTNTPALATNHVCFEAETDFERHEVRVAINQGMLLEDENRPRDYVSGQYFKTKEEMATLFADYPILLENAARVAQKCNVELTLGKSYLPTYENELGLDEAHYLEKAAKEGLEERLKALFGNEEAIAKQRKAYDERLAFEIDVINQMGFPGYFLIVADFIQWSKKQQIPVGPGRGSGAGSLVAYALNITDLDPLAYDLLFERFLNPERVSMPDFDVDFCMEKRDLVIDYVAQKYGREKVSQIATHGTMAAKAVVRDVGRVLGNGYGFVDGIAKLIPTELGITLPRALEQEPELKLRYDTEEEVKILLDFAMPLEGLARNVGKHAGGVVIAPSKLTDFSALYAEPDGKGIIVQYDKDDIEAAGLVKFDFLGLRTLTIIDWALQEINSRRQKQGLEPIDINQIPLDDEKTYALLKACQTTAVFQLESAGMKDLIKRLQPDRFDDIIALVALFRPGPLGSGMVDDFINVKHGRAEANYPLAELKPILQSTYGVILYQEQVMQIAQVLASYTLGQADMLRRAMGKKKPEEMAKQRQMFLDGATKNGHDSEKANYIFDLMEKFAGYGFNKSHSAAYALLAYQTAWLKAHYPEAFMAAVMSADMDNTNKIVHLIEECQNMHLRVRSPSINESQYRFTVNDQQQIIYGLGAIKGAGEAALQSLIDYRQSQQGLKSIYDFFLNADFSRLNKRVLEALITAGVFDEFEPNRRYLLTHLNDFLRLAEQHHQSQKTGQADLFGGFSNPQLLAQLPEFADKDIFWSDKERLMREKAALGLYLSGHPIDSYQDKIKSLIGTKNIASLQNSSQNTGRAEDCLIAGFINDIRLHPMKNGQGKMAFVRISDQTGQIEVQCFHKTYEQYRTQLQIDEVIFVQGRLIFDERRDSFKINAQAILSFAELDSLIDAIQIKVRGDEIDKTKALLQHFHNYQQADGARVFMHIVDEKVEGKLLLPFNIATSAAQIASLRELLADDASALQFHHQISRWQTQDEPTEAQ